MSNSASVRAQAARTLAQVVQGRSLDTALQIDAGASAQDRGLLRSLCFDSVRWYLRLEALLRMLLARPDQKVAPEVRALAIVGLCQLSYTHIPAHAAVDETVNAAALLGHARAGGFINAILRRYLREKDALEMRVDGDLAVRTAHPLWLLEQLARDWPENYRDILDANNQRPPFWIRVNRLRIEPQRYRADLAASGLPIARALFGDHALCLERAVDVAELPGFAQGHVSVQDAAAQLAAHLLQPRTGDRVLDACAAPGGKTGHVLELQPELDELVAVDLSAERLKRVEENLGRLGLCATLVAADAAEASDWWDGRPFQRILLDVPCSGTGVIRRHPDIKLLRRPGDIHALAARQARLLDRCWALLTPGGRIVYAACSALQAETAEIVAAFLEETPQAHDVTAEALCALGMKAASAPGHRIAAGSAGMDGFYYACLERRQ